MNSNSSSRIRFVLGCISLFALILISKLYYIQILHGDEYTSEAEAQYSRQTATSFERGTIFFETKNRGTIGVATVKEGYSLIMNPKVLRAEVKDISSSFDALTQYVKLDKASFMEKSAKQNDQYEELDKRLDRIAGIAIGELNIPGIEVHKDAWRVYPGGSLASHTIGLVGYNDKNEIAGRYGLERFYEKTLRRTSGASNINFFAELFSNIKGHDGGTFSAQNKEGDIVATIDPTVESELEKVLSRTRSLWKSDSIGGIIMNPATGEIYAMSSLPDFDPNNLKDIKDPVVFSNKLVESVYEMGSIIKPLTMAVGLDSKVITSESTYDDAGFLLLNTKRISNFDGKARGVIQMQEILSQSLNVGAATIALKVGNENFSRYFLSFGFGDITGIDQPNEQKGRVTNLKSGREIEQATASYGQGISMSPMTTIRALSVIANGGMLIRPHIVKEIRYTDGSIEKLTPNPGVRVVQKSTSDEVTRMLVQVVDKAIAKAHPEIHMDRYSIAAKTGTAQIADPVNGGYYTDRYLHSFFGYFPAYSPKYIVFLYQVYPKGAEYASQTLTDPFTELAKFMINYYEVPPDR